MLDVMTLTEPWMSTSGEVSLWFLLKSKTTHNTYNIFSNFTEVWCKSFLEPPVTARPAREQHQSTVWAYSWGTGDQEEGEGETRPEGGEEKSLARGASCQDSGSRRIRVNRGIYNFKSIPKEEYFSSELC